jgi:hypothetical protein
MLLKGTNVRTRSEERAIELEPAGARGPRARAAVADYLAAASMMSATISVG